MEERRRGACAFRRANNKVAADRGQASIERGPVVYAAEWPDNNFNIQNVLLNQQPTFTTGTMPYAAFIADSLKNKQTQYRKLHIETLTTPAQALVFGKDGKLSTADVSLKLIPYFAWAHRGNGNMKVWLPQDVSAARPAKPATLASKPAAE